jgi:hypothetical protein
MSKFDRWIVKHAAIGPKEGRRFFIGVWDPGPKKELPLWEHMGDFYSLRIPFTRYTLSTYVRRDYK